MASLVTNRGKYLILQGVFRNAGLPTSFYMALADQTTTPTVDHNAFNEHTKVPAGMCSPRTTRTTAPSARRRTLSGPPPAGTCPPREPEPAGSTASTTT